MSAREYIFSFYAPCAYQYNQESSQGKYVLGCAGILNQKISKPLDLISPLKCM